MGLVVKPQVFIDFLKDNGYTFIRVKGTSHHIYSNGKHSVPIPIHKGKDYDEGFVRLLLRETGLTKNELKKFLNR